MYAGQNVAAKKASAKQKPTNTAKALQMKPGVTAGSKTGSSAAKAAGPKMPTKKSGVTPKTVAGGPSRKAPMDSTAKSKAVKKAKAPMQSASAASPPAKLKSSASGLQSLSVALERCDCGAADAIREVERLYHQIKIGSDAALAFARAEEKRLEEEVGSLEEIEIPNLDLKDVPLAQRMEAVTAYKDDLDRRHREAENTLRDLAERRAMAEADIKKLDKRESELLALINDLQTELSEVDVKEAPLISELRRRQNKLVTLEAKYGERQKELAAIRAKLKAENKRLQILEDEKTRYLAETAQLRNKSAALQKEAATLESEEKKAKLYFDNKLSEYREYELLDAQLKSREGDLNNRLEQLAEAEQRHQEDSSDYNRRCDAFSLSEQRRKELRNGEEQDDSLLMRRKDIQSALQALQAKHDLWEQNYDIHERTLQELQSTVKCQDDRLRLLRRQYAYLLETRGLTESQFLENFLRDVNRPAPNNRIRQ